MTELAFYSITLTTLVLSLYFYAKKTGGIKKSNLKDWWPFLILGLISLLFIAAKSHAEEIKFFQYTEVYLGLDYHPRQPNSQCYQDAQARDNINSNGGIIQNLLEVKKTKLELVYTHHSCAIADDRITYDAIGIRLNYRIVWSDIFNQPRENHEQNASIYDHSNIERP